MSSRDSIPVECHLAEGACDWRPNVVERRAVSGQTRSESLCWELGVSRRSRAAMGERRQATQSDLTVRAHAVRPPVPAPKIREAHHEDPSACCSGGRRRDQGCHMALLVHGADQRPDTEEGRGEQ
jgi:hypothetical protein